MLAALIQNNIVQNIIVADATVDPAPDGFVMVNIDEANPPSLGCGYDPNTGQFTATPSSPPEVPENISRRQCARQLFIMGLITGPEAVDMARSGIPPSFVQTAFNNLPQNDQYIAEMDFAANTYTRSNPLLNSIMVANGNTQEELDQFFIDASAL